MTKEEFIKILDRLGYAHEEEYGNVVVTFNGDVRLDQTDLIPGIVFKNRGMVRLLFLTQIPDHISFLNGGDVQLDRLEVLPPHTIFSNKGEVYLTMIKAIPREIQFNNKGSLVTKGLVNHDFWVEGINNRKLYNRMIKIGVFENRYIKGT